MPVPCEGVSFRESKPVLFFSVTSDSSIFPYTVGFVRVPSGTKEPKSCPLTLKEARKFYAES